MSEVSPPRLPVNGPVLLINPPGRRLYLRDCYCNSVAKGYYLYHPVDLLVAGAWLRGRFDLHVHDALALRSGKRESLDAAAAVNPAAVIGLTSWASWAEDAGFYRDLKKRTGALIILSGSQALHEPAGFLLEEAYPFTDALALSFLGPWIGEFLASDGNAAVPNIVFRRDGELVQGERRSMEPMFDMPPPPHDMFPLERYRALHAKSHPFASVLASEGCPYSCGFCIYGTMKYRPRSPHDVFSELAHLHGKGVREVYFRDYTFGASRPQLKILLEGLQRAAPGLGWSCQVRPDIIDAETLKSMKQAGCHTLLAGFESGEDRVLEGSGKRMTAGVSRKFVSDCRRLGIRTAGYFIFGLPGEDAASAEKTTRFAIELGCDFAAFSVATPIPGTRFFAECGVDLPASGFETAVSYPLAGTGSLSRAEIWRCRNRAVRRFYFRPRYIAGKFITSGGPGDLWMLTRQAAWIARETIGRRRG